MMPLFFAAALQTAWMVLGAYWLWSARFVKRTTSKEPWLLRFFAEGLPLFGAFFLLAAGPWIERSFLRERFVPHHVVVYSLGLALVIAGTALAIHARALLGRNWSITVAIKEGHELVTQGAYAHVRHPIYSGLLLMFFGNAVMVGDWGGLLGVALVFASFWRKLRREERWLAEHFGEAYVAYRARTRALIPGVL